jgi:hypothetical protein
MQYRVNHEQRCRDSLSDLALEREVEIKENLDATAAVAERVNDTGVVDAGRPVVQMVGNVGKAVAVDAPVSAMMKVKSVAHLDRQRRDDHERKQL